MIIRKLQNYTVLKGEANEVGVPVIFNKVNYIKVGEIIITSIIEAIR